MAGIIIVLSKSPAGYHIKKITKSTSFIITSKLEHILTKTDNLYVIDASYAFILSL